MSMRTCEQFLEGVVALALGEKQPDAADHVQGCLRCKEMLNQFKVMAATFHAGVANAPVEAVDAAKRLLTRRPSAMRLAGSSLQAAGARAGESDSFQLVFEDRGIEARLLYSRSPEGWQVIGRVQPEGVSVFRLSGPVDVDADGRFSFAAAELSDTELRVSGPGEDLLIPAASEVSSGPGRTG